MSGDGEYKFFFQIRDGIFRNSYDPIDAELIGYYSVLADGNFDDSPKSLKYFREPSNADIEFPGKGRFDLNDRVDEVIKKIVTPVNMDRVLTYISEHKADATFQASDDRVGIPFDIVTNARLLTMLMSTPNSIRSSQNLGKPYLCKEWKICAVRFRGTTYLCVDDGPSNWSLKQTRWHFKFEQLCHVDQPGEKPNTDVPVNERTMFNGIYRSDLGARLQVLYTAGMDGLISDTAIQLCKDSNLSQLEFIKVKSKTLKTKQQKDRFAQCISQEWWCQCELRGTQKLCVGLHDGEGKTEEIRMMSVEELRHDSYWQPQECIHFLKTFLSNVQELLSKVDSSTTMFEFHFDGEDKIWWRKYNGEGDDFVILKDWYLARLS